MATQTQTIDCQVHCCARNTPERPWRNHLEGPDEVTGDDMVAAMDAVGVDGAILISPFSLYGYDPSYILGVYDQHPGKFGLVLQLQKCGEEFQAASVMAAPGRCLVPPSPPGPPQH